MSKLKQKQKAEQRATIVEWFMGADYETKLEIRPDGTRKVSGKNKEGQNFTIEYSKQALKMTEKYAGEKVVTLNTIPVTQPKIEELLRDHNVRKRSEAHRASYRKGTKLILEMTARELDKKSEHMTGEIYGGLDAKSYFKSISDELRDIAQDLWSISPRDF